MLFPGARYELDLLIPRTCREKKFQRQVPIKQFQLGHSLLMSFLKFILEWLGASDTQRCCGFYERIFFQRQTYKKLNILPHHTRKPFSFLLPNS